MSKQPPFKVGDLVLCRYNKQLKNVVRKVTKVRWVGPGQSSSGFVVAADGGSKCDTCGCGPFPKANKELDAGWYSLAGIE